MLRAVLALGGTAAGLAALLSFKSHPAATAAAAPATSSAGGSAANSAPKHSAGKTGAKSSAGKNSSGAGAGQAAHTVTGTVANTPYGPMQVEVTLAGKRITNVKVLQQTDDGTESQQIDSMAIPKLTSETLAAQSAQIDAVSGASYTSDGYKKSLQSALDKA